MSHLKPPKPVKLVIGAFTNTKNLVCELTPYLTDEFGPIDLVSAWFPFDDTDYYENEMGADLYRRMFAFRRLIDPGRLCSIKHSTIAIENKFSESNKRKINLDPGYLALERFVLATGKNYTHRIYIGDGVYADLTLIYQKGDFQILPWTYPDYAKENIRSFLMQVRNKYSIDLKGEFSHDQKHDGLCKS